MEEAFACVHAEVMPPEISAALSTQRRGTNDMVIVGLTNTGRQDAACRFSVSPPKDHAFNSFYVGATGTAPYEWQARPAPHGQWLVEVNNLPPGGTAHLDFALAPN